MLEVVAEPTHLYVAQSISPIKVVNNSIIENKSRHSAMKYNVRGNYKINCLIRVSKSISCQKVGGGLGVAPSVIVLHSQTL